VIKFIYSCFLILALGSILSCNDPAFIDTDLVNVDLLDIEIEDDFDISASTVTEDSILAYAPGQIIIARYPFGIADDPVFGRTTASTVVQPFLTTTSPPTFAGAVVDSVVMEVVFNPEQPFYGDTTGVLGIEVFEVEETLDAASDFYSNFRVQTGATPIGSYSRVPNFQDSIESSRLQGDTVFVDTYPPHIRFRLANNYGERVINAGDILLSTTDFITTFKGLELRPTMENEGLVAFDFDSFVSGRGVNINGATVMIYYTQNGEHKQYNLAVNATFSVKFPQYEQDYSGSIVGEFLNHEILGDSLIFVQGMSGSNAVVQLEDIASRLNGSLINGATLEVYATAFNNDEDIRPVPPQLVLRSFDDNGVLSYIRDFQSSSFAGTLSISGGEPEDVGNGIYKYTFDVVSELQDIINGKSSDEIYIRVSSKVATMNRVVLFGADHSTYPIRLNVTYTKL